MKENHSKQELEYETQEAESQNRLRELWEGKNKYMTKLAEQNKEYNSLIEKYNTLKSKKQFQKKQLNREREDAELTEIYWKKNVEKLQDEFDELQTHTEDQIERIKELEETERKYGKLREMIKEQKEEEGEGEPRLNRLISLEAGLLCLEDNMIIDGAMADNSMVEDHDQTHSVHSGEHDEYGVERDESLEDMDYSEPLIVEHVPDEAFNPKVPLLTVAQKNNNKKRSSFLTPAKLKSDKLLFNMSP